jgi:two-component system sensor histidine kinase YesM
MEKTLKNSGRKYNNVTGPEFIANRNRRFFLKNFFLFIMPTLIPILILGTFSVIISNNFNRDNFRKNNSSMLRQMKTNIDLVLNEMETMNINFSYNNDISVQMKKLMESPAYTLQDYRINELVNDFISSPANSKPFIHCVYVYFNNNRGRFISSSGGLNTLDDFADTSWFKSFSEKENGTDWWAEIRHISHYDFQPEIPVLTVYKKIYSPGVYRANGVIVMNIYLNYLQKMLEDLATFKEQALIVIDENGAVMFGNEQAGKFPAGDIAAINKIKDSIFTYKIENTCYNVFKLDAGKYGWEYVSVVPDSSFNQIAIRLRALTVSLLALSMVLAAVLAYYLTRKNLSSINKIISIIDSAENERPLPPLPAVVKDEYSYIIHSILNTFMEQNYLKLQLSERKFKQQAAELLTLQSQINPHFLNNTLETIYWEMLRISSKPTVAHKMLENLSDMLQYSLNSKDDFVDLKDEIENTKSYINIQKYRYEDKFDVYWDYPPEVNNCKIKKLILQPLVENSIYHGVNKKEGNCYIKIKIRKSESHLRIFVADNGAGILPERLKEIKQRLESSEDVSEHIGLFNTNKRLKLTYGDEYGIRIRSLPQVGTVIHLCIPL